MADIKKPVKRLKRGFLEVCMWENETKDKHKFYTYTWSKSYKDGETWKKTQVMTENDLLSVGTLLQQMYLEQVE